jgi:hypothetical protein
MALTVAGHYVIPEGHRFLFGRGSDAHAVDLVVSRHASVSRVAGWVEHGVDGVVRVASTQWPASGSVSVERPDGVRIAVVPYGAEHAVPVIEPEFVVVLRADVVVRLPVSARLASPTIRDSASIHDTQVVWTPERVLRPRVTDYWRLVAAVAAVHATVRGRPGRPAVPKSAWLLDRLARCQAAGMLPRSVAINQSWLSRQLEKAVIGLQLDPRGDKVPAIVDALNSNGLLKSDVIGPLRSVLFAGEPS